MFLDKKIEAVVTVIVYNEDDKALFIQDPKWDNSWTYPGGHIEFGETIFQAAVREINEELGIPLGDLDVKKTIDSGEKINSEASHGATHFVYFTVACKTSSADLKINKGEVSDYKWLKPQEALNKLSLGPNDTKSTKKFIKYINKQQVA